MTSWKPPENTSKIILKITSQNEHLNDALRGYKWVFTFDNLKIWIESDLSLAYSVIIHRTNIRKFSLKYQGPSLWNDPPREIRSAKCHGRVQTHLSCTYLYSYHVIAFCQSYFCCFIN